MTQIEDNKAYWIDKIHMLYVPGKGYVPKRITVCSNCGNLTTGCTRYCPDCGKHMVGRVDERPQEYRKGSRFI